MFQIREGVTVRKIGGGFFDFVFPPRQWYEVIETGEDFMGYTGYALEDYLSWKPEERCFHPEYCAQQKEFKINDEVTVIQTPHEDNCPPDVTFGSNRMTLPMKYRYKVVQFNCRFIGSTGDPEQDYYASDAERVRERLLPMMSHRVEEPMDTS